jgi:hypothetical protein
MFTRQLPVLNFFPSSFSFLLDPGWENCLIRDKHPGSSTLLRLSTYFAVDLFISSFSAVGWQGSAFQLGGRVAAPPAPPTSCLKVRHMFGPAPQPPQPSTIRDIQREILQRCDSARCGIHFIKYIYKVKSTFHFQPNIFCIFARFQ